MTDTKVQIGLLKQKPLTSRTNYGFVSTSLYIHLNHLFYFPADTASTSTDRQTTHLQSIQVSVKSSKSSRLFAYLKPPRCDIIKCDVNTIVMRLWRHLLSDHMPPTVHRFHHFTITVPQVQLFVDVMLQSLCFVKCLYDLVYL